MTDSQLVTDTLALFSEQFKDSQKVNDLMRCFLRPLDEIKSTAQDLLEDRWIDTAEGAQLDGIGAIVGVAREGRTDDRYREAIRFQIFINLSKTEPETIIKAVRVITGGDFIRYWEHGNGAGFQVFTNGLNVFTELESTYQLIYLELSGGGNLLLSGGADMYLLKSVFTRAFALIAFLRSITAAGVDFVSLSYSLGRTPIFGFGNEFETGQLVLSSTEYLEVTGDPEPEPTRFEVFTDRSDGISPDGFQGFAEVSPAEIILSDGRILAVNYLAEDVPLSADYVGLTVGGGKLVEGTRDYG